MSESIQQGTWVVVWTGFYRDQDTFHAGDLFKPDDPVVIIRRGNTLGLARPDDVQKVEDNDSTH